MKFTTFEIFKTLSQTQSALALNQVQLHALQQTLLEMMDDIVDICEQYNLCYFLGGGSALGAMRHHGFIPWDDDLDVNMPRYDYMRFLEYFREKYENKYWIHTPHDTHNYGLSMAKIRKKGTIMREIDDFSQEECGICVDIFIIENVFNSFFLRTFQGYIALILGYCLSCRKFFQKRKEYLRICKSTKKTFLIFYQKIVIGALLSFMSLDSWCRLVDKWHRICRDDKSKYVSGCSGRLHFFGEMYLRETFCKTKKVLFEGRSWNVPVDVNGYLTHCYGDWKQPPPKSKRETHYILEFKGE